MIAYLKGQLLQKEDDSAVVESAGVGYRVFLSARNLFALPNLGATVEFFIHTIVREDEISLYGFREAKEAKMFALLMTVNGCGPKMSLAILNHFAWMELAAMIERDDALSLRRVKGVGEKTAKLITLTLQKKVKDLLAGEEVKMPRGPTYVRGDILRDTADALSGLGYGRNDVERVVGMLDISESSNVQGLIKESLKILSQGGLR